MKKVKRLLALGAAALMLSSVFAMPASAANYGNTSWNFNVDHLNKPYITETRSKEDSSGTYVYYKEGTVTGVVCDVITVDGKSMCDGRLGTVHKGDERLIAQYVYERGYRECKLKLKGDRAYDGGGGAGGQWSPDSVGSYPYANR